MQSLNIKQPTPEIPYQKSEIFYIFYRRTWKTTVIIGMS